MSGLGLELLPQRNDVTPTPGLGDDFMQGLRSGANAATSQLHKLAGTTMNAVGLDGSEQNAKAAVDSAYSQVDGRDLVPFHDIKDVSSGLRWGAGMLGQSVPMVGAALGAGALTGGAGVLPALAAGTAAVAPMEIGAQLQRQEQDPANRYATPAQNLRAAVPAGAAAAAAYNVIPAGVASRMIGKAGGGFLSKIGADIVGQGAATGVAEGIHQVGDNIVNPNAGYDVGKMLEAIPEGMAAGAVFGGAHAAKHIVGAPGRVLDSAKGLVDSAKGLVPDSVKERFRGGKKDAAEATDAAAEWTKDKFDYTAEAAEKAATWAKGTIKAKVADVQAWGKEFMDDPAAPESFKAKVQDAIRNPGDQAKAAWLATQAFAKEAKAKAGEALHQADFPSRLRAVHKTMSDGSKNLMERLSRGEETADTAEILKADGDPAKLTEIFDKADQTTASKLKEWGDSLLNEHLGEEKTAQLKQWMGNLGDKASQQGIAAMRMAQDAGKDLAEKASKFADAAKAKVSDATAKKSDTLPEGLREKIGTAIMDVLGDDHPALNSRFARSERGDVRVPLQDLADGLRHVVIAAAEGKPVSSSTLVHLYDVAGDKTRALIDAVHTAVGEPAAGNADFFKSIEAAVQAGKGRDGVLKTMQKSLKPELQAAVRPAELKQEAEVLRAWLTKNDSDAKAGAHRVVDGQAEIPAAGLTASAARIANRDAVMRDALEHRYGSKTDAVLEAVRADIAKEQQLTEPTRTEKLDSDNDVREDVNAGKREGKGKDETTRTHFYPQKGQLYLDPQEVSKGKSSFDDPATQRIKTAKKENPDAQVEFRRVKDLDEKDPEVKKMVDAKYEDLVETAMNEGLTETEAMARATKELDSYGLVVAEQSKQETRITPRELDSMRLNTDPKYAGSKSRIDTVGPKQRGNVILDGVKITEFMNRKMKVANEYSEFDDLGSGYRDARMFAEGVAALTDRLGHSFKIPDSAQITRQGMTWGQAKKLLAGKEGKSSTPTNVGKGADLFEGAETMVPGSAQIREKVRRLEKQRADIEADVQEIGEARIDEMKARGVRLNSKNVGEAYARAREPFEEKLNTIFQAVQKLHKENVGDDSAGFQAYDETGFGGEIERGINVNKLTHDRPVKGDLKKGEFDTVAPGIKPGSATQSARTQRINELEGDMSRLDMNKLSDRVKSQALWREAEILRNLPAEPLGSGRSEIDPFGPTHDVLRGKGEFVADTKGNLTAKGDAEIRPISINSDGSARDDTVMGRRRPGQSHPDAKQLPTQPASPREAKAMQEAREDAAAQKVIDLAEKMGDSKVAAQRALAEKMRALDALNKKYLTKQDKEEFYSIPDMESMADRAVVINRLAEKYRERIEGGPPSPKSLAAKKAAFLEKTRSGDPELLKTLASHDDAKALQRAVEALKNEHGENSEQAIDTINRRIVELIQDPDVRYGMLTKKYTLGAIKHIPEIEGEVAKNLTSYDPEIKRVLVSIRRSVKGGDMERARSTLKEFRDRLVKAEGGDEDGAATVDAFLTPLRREVLSEISAKFKDSAQAYLDKVIGKDVIDTYFSSDSLFGAGIDGAYVNKPDGQEIIVLHDRHFESPEVSRSIVYHESAHALFRRLLVDKRFEGDAEMLVRVATSEKIQAQLDAIYADKEGTREYYKANPEEAVAYMYQHWAEGKLEIIDKHALTVFQRIKAFLDQVVNALTDQGRTEELLRSFKEGRLASEFSPLTAADLARSNEITRSAGYINYNIGGSGALGAKASREKVTPGQAGPVNRKAVMDYLERVHGPNIQVAWKNILHAGEFERTATGDVIRLSIHSLDPTSVAYHEALHGFMAKLHDARHGDIAAVLMKAGESAPVMKQLREHLKNEPDALKQLSDPEERAAYMYQFWAQGKLKLGEKATTIFQRIAKFLREVTGMWTNDQRAEKIMEYFHSGEYEKNRHLPNAVRRALMEAGTSRVFEKAKAMTEPLREMGEALASAGGTRLRDTGIPALRELADAMKLKTTTEGADPGYLPAARGERSRVMNQIGADLKGYTADQLDAALHQLQTGQRSNDVKVRTAAAVVSKHLANMLTYMQGAGVRIEHLGMTQGVPYFPRSWDASYISTHQKEFLAMIAKYPQFYGDPHKTMQKLMVTDGAEFNVEVDKPGMQASKERTLAFISHADAAPFMRKSLHQILNNYVTQATRRAEWARRFKDDGSGVRDLIAKAEQQGATAAQLEAASKFVRAVDGTLGDTINPVARRAMGDMLVYQNIRLLPLAIFSSMVDSQGIMVRGGTVGEAFSAFKRGMKEVVKNFQKDPKSDAMTELAEAIGTIDNAHLVHTMGASYSQGMVGDTGRKWNDTFFRLNLMEQYNASMRVSATEAALNFIARHATRPGQHSERFLRELGLEAKDVQIGQHGRPKVLEHEGLSLAESAKMKAAVNRWVDGAVLRPDAVDKPIWMSDPHFALVAHLKQFVFSFHETILKRVMHEAQNGNFSPALALASYVPMMIAADMVKGLIQGGGDQPQWKAGWGVGDYLWNGGERAGLFGTAQFAIDALGDVQRGGSGVGALTGPTIEQLTDAVRVMGGREHFKNFAVDAMPANTLYSSAFDAGKADPKFSD